MPQDDVFAPSWAPRMLSVLRIMTALLFLAHGTQKLFGFPTPQYQPDFLTLSWFAAASFTALLISSLSVLRVATNLKSIIETFGVGTRIATPSSLPFSSGSTRPTAFAAPVEVGIIDIAAARPR